VSTTETAADRVQYLVELVRRQSSFVEATEAKLVEARKTEQQLKTDLAEAEKAAAKKTRGQVLADQLVYEGEQPIEGKSAIRFGTVSYVALHEYADRDSVMRYVRQAVASAIDSAQAEQRKVCAAAVRALTPHKAFQREATRVTEIDCLSPYQVEQAILAAVPAEEP
jgi:hypothetical protein